MSYMVTMEAPDFTAKGVMPDNSFVVRHIIISDAPLGHSIGEALRTVKAFQFSEKHGVVCSANWQEGEDTMAPNAQAVAAHLAESK